MLEMMREAPAELPALAERTAIVTGSTSGIGLGIARALAAAGARVMLNGLGREAEIERIRAEMVTRFGTEVRYHAADMGDPEAIDRLIADTESALGPVDILVNNAGIQHVSPIEKFSPERWRAILDINLSAAFYTTRAVFAGMKARGFGRIVNIASAHALVASPYKAAYVAAKHGVLGLTKVVALEGAESGVTCNAICPGYVWTPLVEKQIDDQARSHRLAREEVINRVLLAQQPSKRFVEVDELGALAVFLATPAAASITGIALPVDGGWTAH